MKSLLWIMLVSILALQVRAEENFTEDTSDRELAASKSYTTTEKGEQYQCYPDALVKRWHTKKKVEKKPEPQIVYKEVEKEVYLKNRVSLVLGRGLQRGLTVSYPDSSTTRVENEIGFVGGLQYQRLLTRRFSLGAQIQTNKTVSILGGLDF